MKAGHRSSELLEDFDYFIQGSAHCLERLRVFCQAAVCLLAYLGGFVQSYLLEISILVPGDDLSLRRYLIEVHRYLQRELLTTNKSGRRREITSRVVFHIS